MADPTPFENDVDNPRDSARNIPDNGTMLAGAGFDGDTADQGTASDLVGLQDLQATEEHHEATSMESKFPLDSNKASICQSSPVVEEASAAKLPADAAESAAPSEVKIPAYQRVFGTMELAEKILTDDALDMHDLTRAMQTNRILHYMITTSNVLRRAIFLDQFSDKAFRLPRDENLPDDFYNFAMGTRNAVTGDGGGIYNALEIHPGCWRPMPDVVFHVQPTGKDRECDGFLTIFDLQTEKPWLRWRWTFRKKQSWPSEMCKWRKHTYKDRWLSRHPVSIINVKLQARPTLDRVPDNHWWQVRYQVKNAKCGQLLEVAHRMEEAAYWHNQARLFHGDHAIYKSPHADSALPFAWLRPRSVTDFDSRMWWPWQRFFEDDLDLLGLVVGTPIVEDAGGAYVGGTHSSSRMIDRKDDEPVFLVDWVGAELSD